MRRAASAAARAGVAVLLGLLVLALARWPPVWARPPLDVRALALFGPAVLLAVVAGLTGRPRPPRPVGGLVVALAVVLAALALIVAMRPPAGLPAVVSDPRGTLGVKPPGAIDVAGPDLRDLPAAHKWSLGWAGGLRAPRTGVYRLWATGRGELTVVLDGHVVLRGEGDPLRAGSDLPITEGAHRLEVALHRTGPGPRLRLGWTWPRADGRPGAYDEVLLPRDLGEPIARAWWWATDALALAAAALTMAIAWRLRWDVPRPLPAPRPVTRGELAWSLAGHLLVIAALSWPLVRDLAGQGVTDRPDGRLNAWILAWDVHALAHAPGRLFQAPIFHPLPDALAFSENLLLPAVLSAPAQALGGPVLAYNVALVASLALSGLGAQLLVRRVSGDRLAAFVAGAFFAGGAHRWIRLAHLHAQTTLVLPFLLLALDRFWQRRTLGRAAVIGVLLALQGLASVYIGAVAALALAVAVALALAAGLRAREMATLVVGLAAGAVLLAPVVRPYLRMRAFEGVEWTMQDVASYAATPESYAASGTRLYGPITQKHLDPSRVRDTLFPGLAILVAGLAGLASAPRRYRAVAVAASAAAVVFSLGPETGLYRFLHEHVLLVRGVRALSRFSLLPVLALCVLAGFALARRWAAALAVFALFALESSNVPIRYAAAPHPSEAARWLAGRPGAVAVLPLGERDTEAMLDGVAHWRPLLNGDSGFMPRPYTREMELLAPPVGEDALRLLRAVDVRHVVAREPLALPLAITAGEDRVFDVPPGEAARAPGGGEAVPTLWGDEGVVADLGTVRRVESVLFELSDAPWVMAPAVAVSADGARWETVPARASLADATLGLLGDPKHALGEVVFPAVLARRVRLPPDVPARPGLLRVRGSAQAVDRVQVRDLADVAVRVRGHVGRSGAGSPPGAPPPRATWRGPIRSARVRRRRWRAGTSRTPAHRPRRSRRRGPSGRRALAARCARDRARRGWILTRASSIVRGRACRTGNLDRDPADRSDVSSRLMSAGQPMAVRRTYLEMTSPGELRGARSADPALRLEPVDGCPPSFYRYLYAEVGRAYRWVDRLPWTDEDIRRHLADPMVSLWLLTMRGAPAGYFELKTTPDAVEIAYFGLLPEFIGRGLGKHLLTEAVERAWALGPRRVWLHTCSLDDRAALPNYLSRGFRPFREETYLVSKPV